MRPRLLLTLAALSLALAGCATAPHRPSLASDGMGLSAAAPREEAAFSEAEPFATAPVGEQAAKAPGAEAHGIMDPFAEEDEPAALTDPVEPLNRAVFWVNDKLYFYVMKPAALGWRYVVPQAARSGIDHFLANITTPVRFVNAALQGKGADAATEFSRFLINSTLGVLGIFDVARDYGGLAIKEEDFGQTLGVYGLGPGAYLVLPFFGPSSLRDAAGRGGDYFLDPWGYTHLTLWERGGVKALDTVNWLSLDEDTYEAIINQSVDPYVTMRNAYGQMRASKVAK